jgi:hypothetical protein
MKIKVGTQLEEETYQNLKIAAARERLAIGEVMQNAVEDYLQQHREALNKSSGLVRFLEPDPLQLTVEEIRTSLGADFFDQ